MAIPTNSPTNLPTQLNSDSLFMAFAEVQKLAHVYRDFYSENPGIDFDNFIRNGHMSWKAPEAFRARFEPLYKKTVDQFAKKYLLPSSTDYKVMELGSGFLNSASESYLAAALPQELKSDITYTDLNLIAVVHANKHHPTVEYRQVQSKELSSHAPKRSLDLVIASCFFDTLQKATLVKTFKGISETLKTGGKVFCVSDFPPYANTIAYDHEHEQGIMCPLYDGNNFSGIQFFKREDALAFIERNRNSDDDFEQFEAAFLQKYIDISDAARASLVGDLGMDVKTGKVLAAWIESKFNITKTINREKYYLERLQEVVNSIGLEVLFFDYDTQELDVPRNKFHDTKANYFTHHHGVQSWKQISDVPSDLVRIKSIMHVMILQKK